MDADELNKAFIAAQETSRTDPPSSMSSDTKLSIYALYKQSEVGPCNIKRPSFFDQVGRAKWDAWSALGALSQEDAKKQYVDVVTKGYSS